MCVLRALGILFFIVVVSSLSATHRDGAPRALLSCAGVSAVPTRAFRWSPQCAQALEKCQSPCLVLEPHGVPLSRLPVHKRVLSAQCVCVAWSLGLNGLLPRAVLRGQMRFQQLSMACAVR